MATFIYICIHIFCVTKSILFSGPSIWLSFSYLSSFTHMHLVFQVLVEGLSSILPTFLIYVLHFVVVPQHQTYDFYRENYDVSIFLGIYNSSIFQLILFSCLSHFLKKFIFCHIYMEIRILLLLFLGSFL